MYTFCEIGYIAFNAYQSESDAVDALTPTQVCLSCQIFMSTHSYSLLGQNFDDKRFFEVLANVLPGCLRATSKLDLAMAIQSDQELALKVIEAGALLQEIQDYVGRDFSKPAKIRFPRGYIRTAAEARLRIPFVKDVKLKSNVSYTMILSDVQHWLLVRTDLSATAKEMIIKLQMFLLGSIVESLTKVYLKGKCGGNFCKRTAYLKEHGVISEQLQIDIDWLWDMRNKMHLFLVDRSEWQSSDYTIANHNRAVMAFKNLLEKLRAPTF